MCKRIDIDDQLGGPRTVAHEIGHCLGALRHAESGLMAEGAGSGVIDEASLTHVCSHIVCSGFASAEPLLQEFRYTPWEEIPDRTRAAIEHNWERAFREGTAKRAIELGVPVSSMVCPSEDRECDQFNPDNRGPFYMVIIAEQLRRVFATVNELSNGNEHIQIAVQSGVELQVLSTQTNQRRRLADLYKSVSDFFSLLPRNAVLPPIEWPEEKPEPIECSGVLKTARQ